MNFLSINIKGVVDSGKSNWIKNIKMSKKINFMCMQETLCSQGNKFIFDQFWGNSKNEMEWVEATGRSGGLVSIWDPSKFQKTNIIKDRNFILVQGNIIGESFLLYVLNVYAPQVLSEKRKLWNKILELKNSVNGHWVMIGDFNEVRYPEDRLNSVFNSLGANIFNEFIYKADLMEYAMGGRKYTFRMGNT